MSKFVPYRAKNVERWSPSEGVLLHRDVGGLFVGIDAYNKHDQRITTLERQLGEIARLIEVWSDKGDEPDLDLLHDLAACKKLLADQQGTSGLRGDAVVSILSPE
jgi:hypothetical protein